MVNDSDRNTAVVDYLGVRWVLLCVSLVCVAVPRVASYIAAPTDATGVNRRWEGISATMVPVCSVGMAMQWLLVIKPPEQSPAWLEILQYFGLGFGYFAPRLFFVAAMVATGGTFTLSYAVANLVGVIAVLVFYRFWVKTWRFLLQDAKDKGVLCEFPKTNAVRLSGTLMFCLYAVGPSLICYGSTGMAELNNPKSVCSDASEWLDSQQQNCFHEFYESTCQEGLQKNQTAILNFANGMNVSALQACCRCGGGKEAPGEWACAGGQMVDSMIAYQAALTWAAQVLLVEVKGLNVEHLLALNVNHFQRAALVCYTAVIIVTVLVFSSRDAFVENSDLSSTRTATLFAFVFLWLVIFGCLLADTFCGNDGHTNDEDEARARDGGELPLRSREAAPSRKLNV